MKHLCLIALTSVTLVSTTLTGCSSLLPKGPPAPRVYTLNAVTWTQDEAIQAIPVSIKVIKPQIAPGLDTERIALRQGANQMDYYADVRWAGDAPTLLQTLVVDNLVATRRIKAVSNDLMPLKSDYTLLLSVTDFQMEPGDQARVALNAKLVRAQDDTVIKTFYYDQKQATSANDMAHIAQAFDRAQQRVLQQLTKDTLATLRHAPPIATPTATVTTVTETQVH